MKALSFFSTALILFLSGCSGSYSKDEIQEFIPGTYVRASTNEFGIEYDTLSISIQNSSGKQYRIVNRWKYERTLDGKKLEPEYKIKTTSALYSPDTKALQEEETLENYTFDIKQNKLFLGKTEYQKIK